MACLAAIAKLMQLTELVLSDDDGQNRLTPRGLMVLTTLTGLQKLDVTGSDVSQQQLEVFWAAVPWQQRQQAAG
uniref:Uncharacterized protein n=1 Tax=Tetradesmus obliquus TaxID=3088 RepID=A0A383W9E6_TETOB|eukprot:jgi/Sobl393_1/15831/SZX73634.1